MKQFFVRILFLFIITMFGTHSYGQNKVLTGAEETAKKVTGWMKDKLELAGDQVDKVGEINKKYAKKAEEIWKSEKSKQDKRAELKKQQMQQDAELRKEFTDKQYATYLEHKKELEKEWKKKMKKDQEDDE